MKKYFARTTLITLTLLGGWTGAIGATLGIFLVGVTIYFMARIFGWLIDNA